MDAQEYLNAMRKLKSQSISDFDGALHPVNPHSLHPYSDENDYQEDSHGHNDSRWDGNMQRDARQAGDNSHAEGTLTQEAGYVTLYPDLNTTPFVFNSPHSGRHYTPYFLSQSRLSPLLLRKSEDALVDQIFQFVPQLGAPLLAATFPRAYVDVNREPFELDPRLFTGPLPSNANDKSVRVAAGLGTIARVVGEGLEIYRQPLSLEEALWRITNFYLPYHRQLRQLIDLQLCRFETAILIDCHSMPSRARRADGRACADIIIGDRYGVSAHPDLVAYLMELFKSAGLTASLNAPYAGGYITEHYGRPDEGVHALQIEINRSLYMDEVAIEPHSGFIEVSEAMQTVFATYMADVTATLSPVSEDDASPLADAAE